MAPLKTSKCSKATAVPSRSISHHRPSTSATPSASRRQESTTDFTRLSHAEKKRYDKLKHDGCCRDIINSQLVKCICDSEIALENVGKFYLLNWNKHKNRCEQVRAKYFEKGMDMPLECLAAEFGRSKADEIAAKRQSGELTELTSARRRRGKNPLSASGPSSATTSEPASPVINSSASRSSPTDLSISESASVVMNPSPRSSLDYLSTSESASGVINPPTPPRPSLSSLPTSDSGSIFITLPPPSPPSHSSLPTSESGSIFITLPAPPPSALFSCATSESASMPITPPPPPPSPLSLPLSEFASMNISYSPPSPLSSLSPSPSPSPTTPPSESCSANIHRAQGPFRVVLTVSPDDTETYNLINSALPRVSREDPYPPNPDSDDAKCVNDCKSRRYLPFLPFMESYDWSMNETKKD
ncbi:hypothetical protein GYMLUDRAFT_1027334 [Collybiopsis luxurians FD-317 M1]|uniref:Uncharacterized protein n=1 Tax=Collybiopsis luxurians FD-317 M1 TaxID=944289 RepID=A0A0D0C4W0_9AGAR|nr:hypothetical protein GYMLUDRAFT_1027334 [Collybiopsis luxurians FD-317 M1]